MTAVFAKVIVNDSNINENILRFVYEYHSVGYGDNDTLYYNVHTMIIISIVYNKQCYDYHSGH